MTSTDLIEFNTAGSFFEYAEGGAAKSKNIFYNSDLYDFSARIYRTIGWQDLQTLADCVNHDKAADTIPGYKFGGDNEHFKNWTNGDTTKISITEYTATYEVDINSDSATDFTADDNLWLRVEVSHGSGNSSYFVKQLTAADIAAGKVVIQTEDSAQWVSQGGQLKPNERLSGDEPSIIVNLVKAAGTPKINDITEKNHLSLLQNGDIVKGFKVTYEDRKDDFDSKTNERTIVDTIDLTKASATNDYNFKSILGNGLYFGIVADRYQQANHAQTNFAANYYQSAGNIDQDLSGDFGGHIYISNFVDFGGNTQVTESTKKYSADKSERATIEIGQRHLEKGAVLHVDSYDRLRTQRDYVAVVIDTPANMTNTVIEPIISQMESTSADLIRHPANVTPEKVSNNEYVVDGTSYASGNTIYVDGDTVADAMGGNINGGLLIKLKKDQTVVFNFDKTETVTIGRIKVQVYDDNGEIIDESANHDVSSQVKDKTNEWLDQYVTRQLVWNLNSAKNITLDGTAGMFLIPDEDSVTEVSGTSSGWLITDGYIINTSGEWHYLYSDLPTSTASLNISKFDITGENEIEGAQLEIRNAKGETVQKWTSEKDENGSTNRAITLAPGEYTLVETGFEVEEGGKTYNVIPTEVKFSVVETNATSYNNKTYKSAEVVIKDADNTKAFTVDESNGYFEKGNSNTIKVCNAEATESEDTKVTISKKEIGGKEELAGAELTITDDKGAVVEKWTSGQTAKEITLENGTYTLKETGGEFKIGDKTYQVTESSVTFTVENGKVKSYTVDDKKDGAVITVKGTVFTIEDAFTAPTKVTISKKEIGGKEELKGAELTIFNEKGTVVEKWTSGRHRQGSNT